jgi:hypothetical protein
MTSHPAVPLEKAAEADFPTEFGAFRIYGFRGGGSGPTGDGREEAVALKMGDLDRPRAAGSHPFAMPDGRRFP